MLIISFMNTSIIDMLERVGLKIAQIVAAGVMIIASVFIALIIRSLMRRKLQQRLSSHAYKPLENFVFYGIIVVGVMLALLPFGISITNLLVAGGFAGIVVGFASQQAVSNFISGLFLLAEQPLKVGDPVTVGNVSGNVVDISVLSTKIRTWDGIIVRIPNSTVFNSNITNYMRTRARRVDLTIRISYDSDVQKAINTILKMIEEHPYCLVNPAPVAFVESYKEDAIVITAFCWAPPQVWWNTLIDLRARLKGSLEAAGVKVPFPQLDLHIKDSTSLEVKILDEHGVNCNWKGSK